MNQVEDILKKLVSFPVFGGQSNLSIIHWIDNYLQEHSVKTYLVYNDEKTKASLHCRIGPEMDGGIIWSGHTDVVPVEGQAWETDPFELTDRGDGKWYGRGSCDMKGFIACCLHLVPELTRLPLKKPIYFAFSYDEEVGCLSAPDLIRHLQATYPEQAQYALIGEPSLMIPTIGQKGICALKTVVNGSAGHSSRIRQEISAIHEMAKLIRWIENKMLALIEAGQMDDRFTPPHSSLHVGKFRGGIATNVIADHAEMYWDIRTIPQDDIYSILADYELYCQELVMHNRKVFPQFDIQTTEHHPPVPALDTRKDQPIVALAQSWSEQQELDAVSYAAEAGQFAQAGYESIICGPGSIDQAHRANEFISKEQLQLGVQMLRKTAMHFCR